MKWISSLLVAVAAVVSNLSSPSNKRGHFAAWEEPQLFSEDLRAVFRSLR